MTSPDTASGTFKIFDNHFDLGSDIIGKQHRNRKRFAWFVIGLSFGWLCFCCYLLLPGPDKATSPDKTVSQGEIPANSVIDASKNVIDKSKDNAKGKISTSVDHKKYSSTILVILVVAVLLLFLSWHLWRTLRDNGAGLSKLLSIDAGILRAGDVESVQQMLRALVKDGDIRNTGAVGVQIQLLDKAVKTLADSKEALARVLADMPRQSAHGHIGRPGIHFCVNLLLAVGIIGTFYGLIDFLTDPTFTNILRDPLSIQGENKNLSNIADSFSIAFGTSLLAYGVHAAGRAMLDILDADADALWSAYQDRVLLPLAHTFPIRPDILQFKLEAGHANILDRVVKAINEAGKDMKNAQTALVSAVNTMAAHTQSMQAVANSTEEAAHAAASAAGSAAQAAVSIGTAMDKSACTFELAAAGFKDSSTALQATVTTLSAKLDDAQGKISAATIALNDAAVNATKSISDGMSSASAAMQGAMKTATGQFDAATQSLIEATKTANTSFAAMKSTVDGLTGTASSLERTTKDTRDAFVTAVTGLQSTLQTRLNADADLRALHLEALSHSNSSLIDVRDALTTFSAVLTDKLAFERSKT